jgi:hypothetical protein
MALEGPTFTRAKWRAQVERELNEMGAKLQQIETGAWRVAKGTAYYVLADLADLKRCDLQQLASA